MAKPRFDPKHKEGEFYKIQPHGFLVPEYDATAYVLGGEQVPKEILRKDGQYLDSLPDTEPQKKNGLETMHCTIYGTENCIQTIQIVKHGTYDEGAERFNGVISGVTEQGGSPHSAAESFRKAGMIPYEKLPFDDSIRTFRQFNSPKPMTKELLALGQKWVEKWEFKHEYVFQWPGMPIKQKQELLMATLPYGPMGISVVAWKMRNGRYWKHRGEIDQHWVELVGYRKGICWFIFDSYDNYIKELEWDYDFGYAKRYSLKKKVETSINSLNSSDMLRTIKFETRPEIYIMSNSEPMTIYWIGGDSSEAWSMYQTMLKEKWIKPFETLSDALYAGYKREGKILKLDMDESFFTSLRKLLSI